jgi:hypothetical protein
MAARPMSTTSSAAQAAVAMTSALVLKVGLISS